MDRSTLERLDRESLVLQAQAAGVRRARVLTRPELIDELLRLDPATDEVQLRKTRGFFGLAKDLLSKVVERGLHLPDAADRLRVALGTPLPQVPRPEPQAVPTVTLAEIYAAQGHRQRALDTLQRVLDVEPEHRAAQALLQKLQAEDYVAPEPPLPPEPEEALVTSSGEDDAAVTSSSPLEEPSLGDTFVGTLLVPTLDDETAETADLLLQDAPEPLTHRLVSLPPERGDECIAVPQGKGATFVWWRLSPSTLQRLVVDEPAFFFVRVVTLVPSWDGPILATRDRAVDPTAGETVIRGLPDASVVRVAIGTLVAGEFAPLAHSPALEAQGEDLLLWSPEQGARPWNELPETDGALAPSVAEAVLAAARHMG